jgi:hypothetical protein
MKRLESLQLLKLKLLIRWVQVISSMGHFAFTTAKQKTLFHLLKKQLKLHQGPQQVLEPETG